MEQYSPFKKRDSAICGNMDVLEDMMLSDISQTWEERYRTISRVKCTKVKYGERESRWMVTRMGEVGTQEMLTKGCKVAVVSDELVLEI